MLKWLGYLIVAVLGALIFGGVWSVLGGFAHEDHPRTIAGGAMLVVVLLAWIALILHDRLRFDCECGGDDGEEDELEPDVDPDEFEVPHVDVPGFPGHERPADRSRVN